MKDVRKASSTGPKSAIGQERYKIYKGVWSALSHASKHACWIQVIALSESVIADRLEARLASLGGQSTASRKIRTASQSASVLLKGFSPAGEEEALLARVKSWSEDRNKAIHELAKVTDGDAKSWNDRWSKAEAVAKEGEKLARDISKLVRTTNTPNGTKRKT